jgi:hypothetical protein
MLPPYREGVDSEVKEEVGHKPYDPSQLRFDVLGFAVQPRFRGIPLFGRRGIPHLGS